MALGSATTAIMAARFLGMRSASDVGATAKAYLAPFDSWLQRQGDGLIWFAGSCGRAFDGAFDAAAAQWRASWLGSVVRTRIERTVAHHEAREDGPAGAA